MQAVRGDESVAHGAQQYAKARVRSAVDARFGGGASGQQHVAVEVDRARRSAAAAAIPGHRDLPVLFAVTGPETIAADRRRTVPLLQGGAEDRLWHLRRSATVWDCVRARCRTRRRPARIARVASCGPRRGSASRSGILRPRVRRRSRAQELERARPAGRSHRRSCASGSERSARSGRSGTAVATTRSPTHLQARDGDRRGRGSDLPPAGGRPRRSLRAHAGEAEQPQASSNGLSACRTPRAAKDASATPQGSASGS